MPRYLTRVIYSEIIEKLHEINEKFKVRIAELEKQVGEAIGLTEQMNSPKKLHNYHSHRIQPGDDDPEMKKRFALLKSSHVQIVS